MDKHTQGPWEVEYCDDGRVAGIVTNKRDGELTGAPDIEGVWGSDDLMTMLSHRIRIVETDGGCYPPRLADARLIAAAPELLAACQEFVRKVEAGEARSTRSYQQMKDAIAKAEGR